MKYRARRKVTSFDVVLDADRGKRRANIVDITAHGARIRLEMGNLEVGASITMVMCGKDYPARVVWNKEGEAGVEFPETLELDMLAAISRTLHRPDMSRKKRFLIH